MQRYAATFVTIVMVAVSVAKAAALSPAFTFQGQLQQGGTPTTGQCDVQFGLFSVVSGPGQLGSTQTVNNVGVTNGLFVVQLNGVGEFGPTAFSGADRFLELAVRCPAGSGSFTSLTPRQPVTAVPYALFAGAVADNAVGSSSIVDGTIGTADLGANAVTSAKITDGSIVAADVSFTFAGSTSKGGPASDVACTGCVVNTELSAAGSGSGQVLTSNGTNVLWQNASGGGLTLPFSGTVTTAGAGLRVDNSSGAGLQGTSGSVAGVLGVGTPGVRGLGGQGLGVLAESTLDRAIFATTSDGVDAIYATTGRADGTGVHGEVVGATATGVRGTSSQGTGVSGVTTTGFDAVRGENTRTSAGIGVGVRGISLNTESFGLVGLNIPPTGVTVPYASVPGGTGVFGYTTHRYGVYGQADGANGIAVAGYSPSGLYGVIGEAGAPAGIGVKGTSLTGVGVNGVGVVGVRGTSNSSGFAAGVSGGGDLIGVFGSANTYGVYGTTLGSGANAVGVYGYGPQSTTGVTGESTDGTGVKGLANAGTGLHGTGEYGVRGEGSQIGVYGANTVSGKSAYLATPALAGDFFGDVFVHGMLTADDDSGPSAYIGTPSLAGDFYGGVYVHGTTTVDGGAGYAVSATSSASGFPTAAALRAANTSGNNFVELGRSFAAVTAVVNDPIHLLYEGVGPAGAVFFVEGDGRLYATVKAFQIDHPLNPEHKYLRHASVESHEMKNVYDGTVVLDGLGEAWVDLPAWFEALNQDFRYQLTPIGAPAVLYVAEEIAGNRFKIGGGHQGLKVSWQVTGVRHDTFATSHPLIVEADKPTGEAATRRGGSQ